MNKTNIQNEQPVKIELEKEEYHNLIKNIYTIITGNELTSKEITELRTVYNKMVEYVVIKQGI